MPLPDFTPDEQYLVDFAKSPTASRSGNPFMEAYVVAGVAGFGFGIYHGSIELLAITFIIVLGSRIYEEFHQRRWLGVWRTVIEKYEAAIAETEASKPLATDHGNSPHGPSH